ncbi:hypothetical protein [Dongia sp.]|uniref:hypothetical protein n=1 Tax=Dongia sp. TaxID=1977262 RepID=UPI00375115CD
MKANYSLAGLAATMLILAACADRQASPRVHAPFADGAPPARACLADAGPDRTFCVIVIGAERTRLAGSRVCSPVASDDLSDTYAVMDWIRAHPEAQDEELGPVIERVLSEMHPCA